MFLSAILTAILALFGVADPDLRPAVRVPGPPAVVNVSSCRSDLGVPAATISIPSISYSCPIYKGGQDMIDSGAITWVNDYHDPIIAESVGAPGTIWLAGHRTTHGAAFRAIPNIADGAIVTVNGNGVNASYRIVGRVYVGVRNGVVVGPDGRATDAATLEAIFRANDGGRLQPRLTLQTCDGEDNRWILYGDLI